MKSGLQTAPSAQSYGNFKMPQKEMEWLSFWQDWEKDGYDTDSPWYRWKVYYSCGQLTEILEKKLAEISKNKRRNYPRNARSCSSNGYR